MWVVIVTVTRFSSSSSMASAYNKSYHCNHGCTHYTHYASNNMHYIESFAMMICRECCMVLCWLQLPFLGSREKKMSIDCRVTTKKEQGKHLLCFCSQSDGNDRKQEKQPHMVKVYREKEKKKKKERKETLHTAIGRFQFALY